MLPVVDVDVRQTRDEKLELLLVEDSNKLGRYDLVEACQEVLELLLDRFHKAVLDNQPDVLLLVLFCNGNVLTIGNQVDSFHSTEAIDIDRKRLKGDVRDVVLQDPYERLVVVQV